MVFVDQLIAKGMRPMTEVRMLGASRRFTIWCLVPQEPGGCNCPPPLHPDFVRSELRTPYLNYGREQIMPTILCTSLSPRIFRPSYGPDHLMLSNLLSHTRIANIASLGTPSYEKRSNNYVLRVRPSTLMRLSKILSGQKIRQIWSV